MEHKRRLTLTKIQKRLALIEPLLYRQRQVIDAFRYFEHKGPSDPALLGPNIDDSNWTLIQPQTYWGQWNANFTLRTRFRIPKDWPQDTPIGLLLNLGEIHNWDFCHPEALVAIDGKPIAGCDKYHHLIHLALDLCDGKEHLLALHGYTGRWCHYDDPPAQQLFMPTSEIVQLDTTTQAFIACARVAVQTAETMEENSYTKGRLLNALNQAFLSLDTREPLGETFYQSVSQAHEQLKHALGQAGTSLDVNVTAIGHSHIDVAWVWPLGQTRRKCQRSFHTVMALMDEFPDYRFTQSQPQLYDYVRQDAPALFEQIKDKVAQGHWEATGGMWVEADCNISGAESLARQLLLGRSFFAEHFGPDADSPILWLPDVFGYAYSLPQLVKQAGLKYFFTTKLAWNQVNRMPYDSFWWQGIDGTKLLTHLGTTPDVGCNMAVTYNGQATPEEIYHTWTHCQQQETHAQLMTVFGHGDGGGGPTREMLENIREMANFPGLPRTKHGRAIDFFTRLEQSSGQDLPTWNGELYLEYHRGTYTTQSRNKRANRKSEFMLHDAEWLASQASLLDKSFSYPHAQLREAWQLVCLNQFHDIIPGSSIGEVYTESLQQYERIEQIAQQIRSQALARIAGIAGGDWIVANPTAFAQDEIISSSLTLAPNQTLCGPDGKTVTTQSIASGTLIDAGSTGSLQIVPLTLNSGTPNSPITGLNVSPSHLENDRLRVTLNPNGDITSIFDKTNEREILSEGMLGNQFQAFEDRPINWDAWDIDIYYDDKMWHADPAQSIRVVESGPLRATLEIKRKILNSEYTQRISLCHNSQQLDIETDIDWQEKHILLKAAFPVDILANEASYEIQWGHVQRPTHRNTPWDWARFEVCAQKWVDLSEGDYGVSLLNDCKYGHDIQDNVMRITLLRSPTMPDPQADQGQHRFKYSLLPHVGPLDQRTLAAAYGLNDPVMVFAPERPTKAKQKIKPLIMVDRKNIVIETIKQAEDGNGLIVRMYEALRQRGKVTVKAGFKLKQVHKTNLLEQNDETLEHQDNSVTFYMRPFEIVTLRLVPDA